MLAIRDLRKTIGGRTLFENAGMTVNYGERVDYFIEKSGALVTDERAALTAG
jgi:hypothetical protein